MKITSSSLGLILILGSLFNGQAFAQSRGTCTGRSNDTYYNSVCGTQYTAQNCRVYQQIGCVWEPSYGGGYGNSSPSNNAGSCMIIEDHSLHNPDTTRYMVYVNGVLKYVDLYPELAQSRCASN